MGRLFEHFVLIMMVHFFSSLNFCFKEISEVNVQLQSCQVDLVKDGGHTYFIRFLDSPEAYPEQRAMAAFVLAAIVDGHRRGQEGCTEAGLIHVCLRLLQRSNPHDVQTEPLFLQWLSLCLGKVWEDFTEAQLIGLEAHAPTIFEPLLFEPQPEVCSIVLSFIFEKVSCCDSKIKILNL